MTQIIEVGQATCNNTVIFKTKCPFHSTQQQQQKYEIKQNVISILT